MAPGSAMPRSADARIEQVLALLTVSGAAGPQATTLSTRYLSPLDHALLEADTRLAAPHYTLRCAPCHGARGDGNGYNARYLQARPAVHAADTVMRERADDTLYDAIAAGGKALGRSPEMPAFGATLAPADMRALVRHIRALCECVGPAWSRTPRS
jgi:mono/diheme cytochrome c family protein